MAFEVFDFRKDIRNVLVTPPIRARFLKMKVGQVNAAHTHDLGHEVFIILQGKAEFEIDGHKEVLEPGQMCIALTDESHIVRNVGDEEVIMYLSVTPHIQPTHTYWNEDGTKKPPRFQPSTAYDVPLDTTTSTEELVDRHVTATAELAEIVQQAAQAQAEQGARYKEAIARGDQAAAVAARNAMWEALYPMYKMVYEQADTWNDLASRTAGNEAGA